MSNKKNKRLSKKLFLILACGVLLAAVIFGLLYKNSLSNKTSEDTAQSPDSDSKIDLSPPTQQEVAETNVHKESLSRGDNQPVVNESGKIQVTPVITSVSQNELRAYVSGIAEDGGDCSATFRQGSRSFTTQSKGFRNVTNTNCETINFSRADLGSSGEWTVMLTYSSVEATGVSQPINFEVQ